MTQLELANPAPIFFYITRKEDWERVHAQSIIAVAQHVTLPMENQSALGGMYTPLRYLASSMLTKSKNISFFQYFCHELIDDPRYLIAPQDSIPHGMTMEEYNEKVMMKSPKKMAKELLKSRFPDFCHTCLYNFCHLYIKTCLEYHWIKHQGDPGHITIPPSILTSKIRGALAPSFSRESYTGKLKSHSTFNHRFQKAMMEESRYISQFITRFQKVRASIRLLVDQKVVNIEKSESKPTENVIESIVGHLELPQCKMLSWVVVANTCLELLDYHKSTISPSERPHKRDLFMMLTSSTEHHRIYVVDVRTKKIVFHTTASPSERREEEGERTSSSSSSS